MMSGSIIGAPFFAWLADFVGVFNIVIFTVTICAGLQFSLLGATSEASVVAIGVLYGFFSAAFQAMLGPIFSRLSLNITEMGHRMGLGFFVLGIGSLIGKSCLSFNRIVVKTVETDRFSHSIGPPIEGALLGAEFEWWKALLFSAVSTIIYPKGFACDSRLKHV